MAIKTGALGNTAFKNYYGVGGPGAAAAPLSPASDSLLSGAVENELSLQEKAALDAANAKAAQASVTGYNTEIGVYGNVEQITSNEALIAGVSAGITKTQQQMELA